MPQVEIFEAALRAGQDALLLSRLRRRHLIPVVEQLDECGFSGIDVFGGGTFEAALRFTGEDPIDSLRALRTAAKRTPLIATLSSQSLVGHRHQPDDVVDLFIKTITAAGVDIVRCADPLNDIRNLERVISATTKAKKKVEGVLVYSDSPRHDPGRLARRAADIAALGADWLCLYDPLGLMGIHRADEVVKAIVAAAKLPLAVAFGAQTGQAELAINAAVAAGASKVYTALSPLAGGASYPAAESLISAWTGTAMETKVKLDAVYAAAATLDGCLPLYEDVVAPWAHRLDMSALRGLLPPAAMGRAIFELRDRGALDRLEAVETEAIRIRAELGHPPLVTPVAEIIAMQAVYNVLDGDRYLTVSQEVKDYCLGLYGSPEEPVDPGVRKAIIGREESITCRPADLLEPAVEKLRQELRREGVKDGDEAVVTYAIFPAEYLALVRGEGTYERLEDEPGPAVAEETAAAVAEEAPVAVAAAVPAAPARELTVEVDGQSYGVRIFGLAAGSGTAAPAAEAPAGGKPAVREGTITAPMQGMILKVPVNVGDSVNIGDVVAVLEAMKMQNDITATKAGKVTAVHVKEGSVVAPRDPIVDID